MENINYKNASLNDLIFEGRNKQYGAYYLRKIYDEYVLRSVGIAIFGFALAIGGPVIWEKIKPEEEIVEQEIVTVDPKMIEPPPIDPKTPPPPPLPTATPPPQVSTVRFVPPEVAPDEEVIEEDPPKQEDLKQVVAGTETVVGDPNADPNELSMDNVGTGTGDVIGAPPEPEPEFTFVEQDPQPPGGDLQAYFGKNIKYPQKAISQDIEGKVFVTFVVTSSGEVDDVKLLKGIGYGCDEEAIRVVKSMPRWTPGKNGGREVKVRMNIPIVFKLAR
jgi:protein TonB